MNQEIKNLIEYKMIRAFESLEEAEIMANYKHWNTCASRLYYACFYAVSGLLLTQNLSSSKHTGIRSLFNNNFVKKGLFPKYLGKLYNTLFESRQESDYDDFIIMREEIVMPWIDESRKFIKTTQNLINQII
jgi:uncharacterized protein (UPF0332 family)